MKCQLKNGNDVQSESQYVHILSNVDMWIQRSVEPDTFLIHELSQPIAQQVLGLDISKAQYIIVKINEVNAGMNTTWALVALLLYAALYEAGVVETEKPLPNFNWHTLSTSSKFCEWPKLKP